MTTDQLEYSIAQYADGTLPAAERAALEARLATDERARAMLEAYRRLDAAIAGVRAADAVPAVRWDDLAARIARATAALPMPSPAQDISESLERAVAQFADGSLPASEREAVAAQIAENPALADLLTAYTAVDDGLRGHALPPVRWDRLALHLSDAVADHGTATAALPEALSFDIAQYADGTLNADRTAAVEAELSANAAARFALADEQSLDSAFASLKAQSMPAVRWERLASHLSNAVADEVARANEKVSTRLRLFPVLRSPMRLAAAASVLLALGFGIRLMRPSATPPKVKGPENTATLIVAGPSSEGAAGAATLDVTIGPPPVLAGAPAEASGFTDDLASRPSSTIIAGGQEPPPQPREDAFGHAY